MNVIQRNYLTNCQEIKYTGMVRFQTISRVLLSIYHWPKRCIDSVKWRFEELYSSQDNSYMVYLYSFSCFAFIHLNDLERLSMVTNTILVVE